MAEIEMIAAITFISLIIYARHLCYVILKYYAYTLRRVELLSLL